MRAKMASSDLLPCPFCGCSRIVSERTSPLPIPKLQGWRVRCLSCGASTSGDVDFGDRGTADDMRARAEKRWNRRARA